MLLFAFIGVVWLGLFCVLLVVVLVFGIVLTCHRLDICVCVFLSCLYVCMFVAEHSTFEAEGDDI